MGHKWVGSSVARKDGLDKVTGQAKYVDDIEFPEMIHGITIRTSIARGVLKNIYFDEKFNWDGFTIVTAKDIPGKNIVQLIELDQPLLVEKNICHADEPVVLLAHPDKDLLQKARDKVRLEVESLEPIYTLQDSLAKKQIIWGKDNIQKSFLVQKGNVDSVFELAKKDSSIKIFEGEYFTGAQEQLYIENQGMVAIASKQDGVTVWGSMQCPYYIHKGLMPIFHLSEDKVRVVQMETGGGFGGKEEYPTILAAHAGLLALKSGKPVKMIYDRAEDMAATTKRHPSRTLHKTAVNADGKLLAMDIDFTLDGGAYATLSSVVLSRGTLHAAGPYECENVRIKSQAVATNIPPYGAFRGFGAPQCVFSAERHLDVIAKELNVTAEKIRRINFLQKGKKTATKQVIQDEVDMNELLTFTLEKTDYHKKLAEFKKHNQTSSVKKGIGFASFLHGAGFTGSGEKNLKSVVGVQATKEGVIEILAASTEIGQGTKTIFAQVAAQAMKVGIDQVHVVQPDTKKVPDSGPTVASRTVMVVGSLVESACLGLRAILLESGFLKDSDTNEKVTQACVQYIKKFGSLKHYSQYKQPPEIKWDDQTYEGDAYAAYTWAVYLAEVSIDPVDYQVTVDRFTAVQEVGKVVHPVLAAGQIEGGVAQGVGYALYEKVIWKDGKMANNRMTNYIMPTSVDIPEIKVYFHELPSKYGPQGAKGIGELPLDGTAPAIMNAVDNAIADIAKDKKPLNEIPFLPEDVMQVMEGELR